MWPDPEDPKTAQQAKQARHERYLMAPPWLAFGFFPRGSNGYWTPGVRDIVNQVMGHAHYMPGTDGAISKPSVRQLVHQYDWQLQVHQEAAKHGMLFANRGDQVQDLKVRGCL